MNVNDMLPGKTWRWLDHSSSGLHMNPLQSFALDDTLCTSIGEDTSSSVMRAWVHQPTIVLGIQDSRLPYLHDGIKDIKKAGYHVIVRNSGGLAVVLDEGIFNLSLLFKENKTISINSGYDFMWNVVQTMFSDKPGMIDAYEIQGSYCPGTYDLSINGKKFAGISQRRIRGGVAVQIYMAVSGSGAKRAALLQRFYESAVKNEPTRFEYPHINPDVMRSLEELYRESLTIQDILLRLLTTFQQHGAHIQPSTLSSKEIHRFDYHYQRVIERNNKALNIQKSR
ncbi:octanoyl-[GcvH]:protein N-octanoyltransferase [Alteribacillus persepolensis]|uniref:Octanoyl-[GcvH]:protein N-octanoyltransferase n=1 Tax=Alteribacillus persepolensis TaxID=568899 RepID=A0A1G8G5H1_9BACI|nr:biotin/lipoate A/B protein ligase family protein [Alteribacillus persepolensis]SDH89663.1 octanoyl-[GcvH]:protein N-octanoyltransferase [Alteribacillus persepolensis]